MAAPIQRTATPFDRSYSEIIDVRSPAEFALDHVPGAINLPSLSNEERAKVGTIYKQVNPFDARKIGAALVFANLSQHLENHFLNKEKDYEPLVYCWRGGQRSGSVATVLSMIGWRATLLDGGYKTYRKTVIEGLETLPAKFTFRIVGGKTGSAKTDVLKVLERQGEQVLDLEGLACHRGSLLGAMPGVDQPSQKLFESMICSKLRSFDESKVVWIESESSKIGKVFVPPALIDAMLKSKYYDLRPNVDWRVDYLAESYAHLNVPDSQLPDLLLRLIGRHSRETVNSWLDLFEKGQWAEVVRLLLIEHYDPSYTTSTKKKFGDRTIPVKVPEGTIYSANSAVDLLLHYEQESA